MNKLQTESHGYYLCAFLKVFLLFAFMVCALSGTSAEIRNVYNINELRSTTASADREYIYVKTYSFSGDGGGGTFFWNNTSQATDNGGTVIAVTGVNNGRWLRIFSGSINIKWFGAVGNGITDDSAAFIAAWETATYFNQIVSGTRASSGLYIPAGTYIITQNYFLNNSGAQPGYTGKKYSIYGDGDGTSTIVFKPSTGGNAYMYDQTQAAAPAYVGLNLRNLQIIFDSSSITNGTIHGFRVYATTGQATQNFVFDSIKFTGHKDSIFLDIGGTINGSENKFLNCSFKNMKTLLRVDNYEALNQYIIGTDIENLYGHAIEILRGGVVLMVGGSVIFNAAASNECALLKVGGDNFAEHSGVTSNPITFINVRCEFRSPKSRSLYINDHTINIPIKFINCYFAKVDYNQSFALVAADQGAVITYDGCVLPKQSTGSKFKLTNSNYLYRYATEGATKSLVRFIGCSTGGSESFADPYVDFSELDFATSSQSVEYTRCQNIADSTEYGHKYGTGRSINPISGKLIPFSGYVFPYGDGNSETSSFFRLYIPYNSFIEYIKVTRGSINSGSADDYELQLVNKVEFDSPGTGVIYGTMPSQKYNLAIDWKLKINKRFSGTKDERTVYLRLKPGTNTCTAPLKNDIGMVYALTF